MERIATHLPTARAPRRNPVVRMFDWLLKLDASYRQSRVMESYDNHMRRDLGLPEVGQSKWNPPSMMRM